jgi:hypothetical protein
VDGWTSGKTGNCTIGAEWSVVVAEEDRPTGAILAGVTTASLIIVVGLLLYLRNRGKKFRDIFIMVRLAPVVQLLIVARLVLHGAVTVLFACPRCQVAFEVTKLTLSFGFEVSDFVTDALSFHRVVIIGDHSLPPTIKIAYTACFGVASVVAVVNLLHRAHHFWGLRSASHSRVVSNQAANDDEIVVLKSRLEWEVEKSKRDLFSDIMTLLTILCEDLPFLVLNINIVLIRQVTDTMVCSPCDADLVCVPLRVHGGRGH